MSSVSIDSFQKYTKHSAHAVQIASLRVKEKLREERGVDATQAETYFEGGKLIGAFTQVVSELLHGKQNYENINVFEYAAERLRQIGRLQKLVSLLDMHNMFFPRELFFMLMSV